ncbi:translation initiation factor IF-2-like [Moschus berezovskii]|uniref:translation initiation factor IF-2-like n=1 Tax=Moschus berezovskii TaxID=68408 RepID=UPI002444E66C|nr:translation initiation factor IF-2-like [Moschus berezovskii]
MAKGDALHRTRPPSPPRQAPKAPSCSRARGPRPRESDPRLGSRRARWQQAGRAARAPGSRGCPRGGAVLAPLPLRARPVPKEDTPPPAGPLPTLRGAASPPARAGPEPPRQPASEGSALGWDLEEAAKEETAAAPRASSPAPTRGLPEESRGSRSGDEAGEEDPGGGAPVSLPRRRRRRLQVSGARSPRGPCLAPRPRGAGGPTDPYRPTDGQLGRAGAPTHAGAAPRLARRPPPLRAAPAARRPQTTTSRPRPVARDPWGRQSPRGTAALRGPRLRAVGPPRPGELRARSPRRRAHRAAATPRGPVGALCPAAGAPGPGLGRTPGKAGWRSADLR